MHHPDHGGDAQAFAAALVAIDGRFGSGAPTRTGSVDVVFRASTRGAAQARLTTIRVGYRNVRHRLPLRRRRSYALRRRRYFTL